MITKMTAVRSGAVAAALAAAAVGLAGPASADPLEGTYTIAVTDAGHSPRGGYKLGAQGTKVATPCGTDCSSIADPSDPTEPPVQAHLQGNSWVGTDSTGCTISIDNASLAGTMNCPDAFMGFQLAKAG